MHVSAILHQAANAVDAGPDGDLRLGNCLQLPAVTLSKGHAARVGQEVASVILLHPEHHEDGPNRAPSFLEHGADKAELGREVLQ